MAEFRRRLVENVTYDLNDRHCMLFNHATQLGAGDVQQMRRHRDETAPFHFDHPIIVLGIAMRDIIRLDPFGALTSDQDFMPEMQMIGDSLIERCAARADRKRDANPELGFLYNHAYAEILLLNILVRQGDSGPIGPAARGNRARHPPPRDYCATLARHKAEG